MDRLDELSVFVAILDAGSLTVAARRLRRSAPSVTRALATLEARLGTRLIERTTRRLTPTETGKRLGVDARHVIATYAEALRQSADTVPRGLLRINDIDAALIAVGAGHGVTSVLSYQVADELASGTLVRLLRAYEPPALPVSLVTASVDPPPRVRAFLAHAVPMLSALAVVRAEA